MMSHELVDRVARDMTDVAPTRDLKADVLARLERAPQRHWMRFARPAIAAGLVVAAFAMTRTAREVTEPVQLDRTASNVTRPAVDARVGAQGPQRYTDDPREPARVGKTNVVQETQAVMSADELAWRSRAVPALEPAALLEVAAIQPTAIQIAPITVEPITVDPIVMTDVSSRSIDRER